MNDIYVRQRANGDVFALDDHGRAQKWSLARHNSIITVIGPPLKPFNN
jgi:hypothetical protein